MISPYIAAQDFWQSLRKLEIIKREQNTYQLVGVNDFVFRYGVKHWGWERRKR